MSITKEVALSLRMGQTLYHKTERNADGTALRVRVNGKVKTWKRPHTPDFVIPVKYGMYQYLHIVPGGANRFTNAVQWSTDEPDSLKELARKELAARQGTLTGGPDDGAVAW